MWRRSCTAGCRLTSPAAQSRSTKRLGLVPVSQTSLEPAPGGTRLRNTIDLELPGSMRLVSPVVTARVKSAVAANLDVLRRLLEG